MRRSIFELSFWFLFSSKMLQIRCLNRRYYSISTGNSRDVRIGKNRAEFRQDFSIGKLNLSEFLPFI